MRFAQDFIEKVRDANNIVDFLSEYTTFRRTGHQHMGRCPFPGHNEKTPSLSVSETKQVYNCFGCGKSGNIFEAVKELKGLGFPEALEYLAGRAGIEMPQDPEAQKASQASSETRKGLYNINQLAAEFYNQNLIKLASHHPVKKYAAKRGLTDEIIKTFHIGYAPDKWDAFLNYIQSTKVPMALVRALKLISKRKDGSGEFDLFRNRLMFPIQNHKSEFIGFGGRALADDQQPKYLNSHESEVFHKGSTFYALNITATTIRQKDAVVVVEGYMDALALYAAGIKNVVATLGTALTAQHAKLLKRYTRNIVILFDGDEAGEKAAERSLPILLAEGLIPKGVVLPDKLDPDEYIAEKGVDSLRNLLIHAPELFNLQLEREAKNYSGSNSDKIALMDKFSPLLNIISDNRLRDLYVEEIAKLLGTDVSWVAKALTSGPNSKKLPISNKTEASEAVTPPPQKSVQFIGSKIKVAKGPKAEVFLLNLALMAPDRFNAIWESEIVSEFSHPGVQELFIKAFEFYGQNLSRFDKLTAYLMTLTETPNEVAIHLGQPFQGMGPEELNKMQADCIKQVRERYLKNKAREITVRMRNQPTPDQIKELERFMNVQHAKRTLKTKNGDPGDL